MGSTSLVLCGICTFGCVGTYLAQSEVLPPADVGSDSTPSIPTPTPHPHAHTHPVARGGRLAGDLERWRGVVARG